MVMMWVKRVYVFTKIVELKSNSGAKLFSVSIAHLASSRGESAIDLFTVQQNLKKKIHTIHLICQSQA